MLVFAISGFFNALFGIIFTIFVYLRHRKSRVYYFFYFACLSFTLWCFGYGMWQISDAASSALFWCRIFSLGATLIPIAFLHCMAALVEKEKEEKWILLFGYIETIFFLAFNFSPLFVNRVEPVFGFQFWPKPGILYTLYIFFDFVLLLGYGSVLLFKNYREATGIRKELIKYGWLVYLLPIIGGTTNFFYWYNIYVPPYGNFVAFLWPVLMGYIISSYRLMDIKLLLGKIVNYFLSFGSVIGLVLLFYTKTIYALIAVGAIILYLGFTKVYDKIISKTFYKTIQSYQKIIFNLETKLVSVLELEKLSLLIIEDFCKNIGVDKVALLVCNNQKPEQLFIKTEGFNSDDVESLYNSKYFVDYLEKEKTSVLYEEVMSIKDNDSKNIIKKIKANLFLPLLKDGKLSGMIILGEKKSGDYYSVGDIGLFAGLANQVSIVIENARLYDQVQDLSHNLQQKVDDQTKELRQAYQTEKHAREELEKLDQTKNQFLLAVQHHLRTPLTQMKWSAEFLLKNKQTKKNKEYIEKFRKSTTDLIKIVNEFLDVTQFQLGKQILNLESDVSLKDLMISMIDEASLEANSKKNKITVDFSDNNDIYNVIADKQKLKVAIFNLVDNAIKYTENGSVEISLAREDNFVVMNIKDTGIGIEKDRINSLFESAFYRGQSAQKTFATGRGIGLYISGKIIKAHNGIVSATSGGVGKGSCFTVKLPSSD